MPTTHTQTTFLETLSRLESEIAKDMIGQRQVVREVLITLIAGGNALLEGVPGLGKTHLVRTLSRVVDLPFQRIQFTPDLMPSDITGTNLVLHDAASTRFSFQPGPLFTSLVLADEINRATPKTQSALLEAMQEHTVTVAGQTRPLPEPFFVLATQNPMEQEGTYPLPEAQLDRFFFKIIVPYPTLGELSSIVELTRTGEPRDAERIIDGQELLALRALAADVLVAEAVKRFALKLVLYTHPASAAPEPVRRYVRYGASPRAAQTLLAAARVRALMEGRLNVSYDDIKAVAPPAMRHRIFLNFDGLSDGQTAESILTAIIGSVEAEEHA